MEKLQWTDFSNSLTIYSNAYKTFQRQTYNIENWIMELLQVEYLNNKDRRSYNEKGRSDGSSRLTDYLDLNKTWFIVFKHTIHSSWK